MLASWGYVMSQLVGMGSRGMEMEYAHHADAGHGRMTDPSSDTSSSSGVDDAERGAYSPE